MAPKGNFYERAAGVLSRPRLDTYRLAETEEQTVILGRYLWNVALGEALSPCLHFLEVGLRNRLDDAISGIAGPGWYDDPNVLVDPRSRVHVLEAGAQLVADRRLFDRNRLIAELPFGFWVGLLNREYEVGPDRSPSQIALWPRLARGVVPHGPRGLRVRAVLSEQLGRFRILRNRAYHHEPLWRGLRDRRGAIVPLSIDHSNMTRLVSAMSPELGRALGRVDRFQDLYDEGPGRWIRFAMELCAA